MDTKTKTEIANRYYDWCNLRQPHDPARLMTIKMWLSYNVKDQENQHDMLASFIQEKMEWEVSFA